MASDVSLSGTNSFGDSLSGHCSGEAKSRHDTRDWTRSQGLTHTYSITARPCLPAEPLAHLLLSSLPVQFVPPPPLTQWASPRPTFYSSFPPVLCPEVLPGRYVTSLPPAVLFLPGVHSIFCEILYCLVFSHPVSISTMSTVAPNDLVSLYPLDI